MIRCMAALDSKRGIADDHGIPWQGRIPSDIAYYHEKIRGYPVLLGYGFYTELSKPYPGGVNYIATHRNKKLREGFEPVTDARQFLQQFNGDIWNLGGAALFQSTIDLADELYLTQLQGDFHCTKFFPYYAHQLELVSLSEALTEGGISFRFEVHKRR